MAEKNINSEIELSDEFDTEPTVEPVAKLHEPASESEPAAVELEIGRDLCRIKLPSEVHNQSGCYGGYRKEILTENLTEREKDILICKKCQGIMKEACISPSGEQFCSCCENSISKGPHTVIRKTINSLKCSCPLIERRCKWLGTLEGCENHLDTCGYVDETCKLNCGEVLRREELERHEKENCLERQVKCDHCDENFISRELNGHLKKCPKMKVSCDLVGCDTKITREDMELHLKYGCGMVEETCELGCGVELTRDKLIIHEKDNCPQRQVKCDLCKTKIKSCQLNRHQDECPKMKVSCDMGCGTKITREDMELHHVYDCGMVQDTCKLGCGVELTRDKLRIHEKENCPQREVKCDNCDNNFKSLELNGHLERCPKIKVLCDLCRVEKYRKDMTQHFKYECLERMLDCPFVNYKCLVRMKRKYIAKHLEEKEIKHLGLKLTAMEDLITEQSEINKKQSEEINEQSKEIKKLNVNIEKKNKEISNTSKQIELIYSITDTSKIIWKIEDVTNLMKLEPSFESKRYAVAGYRFAFKNQYRRLSIIFPVTTIKPDRAFITKCHIVLQSCHTIYCGIIEVKQKDLTRGYERTITYISQEDVDKYSEPQYPGAHKRDLTLEIFITV